MRVYLLGLPTERRWCVRTIRVDGKTPRTLISGLVFDLGELEGDSSSLVRRYELVGYKSTSTAVELLESVDCV